MKKLPGEKYYIWRIFRDHVAFWGFDNAYRALRKRMGK